MAVRIRMKRMGRRNRPFYRICASDSRAPRDGRVLEELGHYDPMVRETDARCTLNHERVTYWLGVGALPSEKVGVLIKKYGPGGTHLEAQSAARERLAQPRALPEPVVFRPQPKDQPKSEATEAPAAEAATAEAPTEQSAPPEAAAEVKAEETPAEEKAEEKPAEGGE